MFVIPTTHVGFTYRAVAMTVAFAVVFATLGWRASAEAANLTYVSNTLTDSAPSVLSGHLIRFQISTTSRPLVPADDITKDYIKDLSDLDPNFTKIVEHFYTHYKDWKKDWTGADVSFNVWGGAEDAKQAIVASIELAKNKR